MPMSTVRPADDEIENTVKSYSDILFKLCFTVLCNRADAEDAVSDTFLKYIMKSPKFKDDEHKKAWLIKVAANICKDKRRFNSRHNNYINLDDIAEFCPDEKQQNDILEMFNLPEKYKIVIHLFYIEGYKTREIAEILNIMDCTVRKRLQYGRRLLKIEYGKDGWYEKTGSYKCNEQYKPG